jgi:endogenous inhibitor of DNA gyrase (YacG/DUF329 family)
MKTYLYHCPECGDRGERKVPLAHFPKRGFNCRYCPDIKLNMEEKAEKEVDKKDDKEFIDDMWSSMPTEALFNVYEGGRKGDKTCNHHRAREELLKRGWNIDESRSTDSGKHLAFFEPPHQKSKEMVTSHIKLRAEDFEQLIRGETITLNAKVGESAATNFELLTPFCKRSEPYPYSQEQPSTIAFPLPKWLEKEDEENCHRLFSLLSLSLSLPLALYEVEKILEKEVRRQREHLYGPQCTVCGRNSVNPEEGEDTCESCLAYMTGND